MIRRGAQIRYAAGIASMALALTLIGTTPPSKTPDADAFEMRDGGLINNANIFMTSTIAPDYKPVEGSSPALKIFSANQALRNCVSQGLSAVNEANQCHRNAATGHGDMTYVIEPGALPGNDFQLLSGTQLPVGFKFGGRGGKVGNPGANPVNLTGQPDSGTATIRFCSIGTPLVADQCFWGRDSRPLDKGGGGGAGEGPANINCPWLTSSISGAEHPTYGNSVGDGPAHIAMLTNDAGPVNRNWGPIPGDTGDITDYANPQGQLWDVARQRWAYARWSGTYCWGRSGPFIVGNSEAVQFFTIFVYKDEPTPGAYSLVFHNGDDAHQGQPPAPDFHTCGNLLATPSNGCYSPYEWGIAADMFSSNKALLTTPVVCGEYTYDAQVADGVTNPGHSIASGTGAIDTAAYPGCPSSLTGTFTNGQYGAVSLYNAQTGAQSTYSCCLGTDSVSMTVPAATCPSGYKIYYTPPNNSLRPVWYNGKDSFSTADCVSAPSSGNDMTIPAATAVDGYVKDKSNSADLDGVVVYAYNSTTGAYIGYSVSGESGGPGRFSFNLASGASYKFYAQPPPGYATQWWSGASSYSEATAVIAPGEANFSLDPSGSISGYVKDASTASDIGLVPIYAYNASNGAFVGWKKTGVDGRYSFNLASGSYKVMTPVDASHESLWNDGSWNWGESTPVTTPATVNFSPRAAANITGTATTLGVPTANYNITAYTSDASRNAGNTFSDSSGNYSLKLATTASSGWQYKLRFKPPSGTPSSVRWYLDQAGGDWPSATNVSSPASGINQDTPA